MAGRNMAVGELTSMNMVPFLGRTKAVGKEFREQTEQSLDAKTGTGSLQFTKAEVAPLFKPQENVQQPYGSQNNSDFFQSRVNPSMNAHNVKPFQEQWVGPGLNQGYGTEGSGGYNSGMEAREKWTEKTVDELRVLTNPKQTFTYDGHMGPAQSLIKNVGIEGKVEKHLPDKFFINTPDRYFTTVGQEVGPTYRSQQMNPDVSRVHVPYVGGAGQSGQEKMPQKPLIRQDHRQQFLTPLALAPAQGPVPASNVAAERKSMTAYANNRTTTSSEHNGNMGALISAITAPVTDFLRPTRKETVLTPKRLGNASMSGPTPQLLPTAKNVPTTTKETTTFSPFAAGMRPYLPASDGYRHENGGSCEQTRGNVGGLRRRGGKHAASNHVVRRRFERQHPLEPRGGRPHGGRQLDAVFRVHQPDQPFHAAAQRQHGGRTEFVVPRAARRTQRNARAATVSRHATEHTRHFGRVSKQPLHPQFSFGGVK
jgi:hypothetical protein